jgi:hypothetical protein
VVQVHIREAAEAKLEDARKELDKVSRQLEKEKGVLQNATKDVSDLKLKISVAERNQTLLVGKLVQKEQEWQSAKDMLDHLVDESKKDTSEDHLKRFDKELAELRGLLSDSKDEQSNLQQRLISLEKSAAAAENVVDVAGQLNEAAQVQFDAHKTVYDEALENLRTAQSESQSFEENAVNLVKEENLFVFRWNADKSKLGSLKLTENMFGNYEKNLGRSGFVIMSGMRSRKLFLSEDDAAKLEKNTHDKHYTEYKPLRHLQWLLPYHHGNSLHIVTHIVETNNEAYVSEQTLKKAADVKVDLKKVVDGGLDVEVLTEATLQAARSALENMANVGTIAAPKISRKPVLWPWTSPESLEEYTAYSEAWIPVMAVTTRLSDLDDIFKTKRLNVNEESSMAHNMPSLSGW